MNRFRCTFLLLLAISASCAPSEPTTLEVEYAGCKAVLVPGPVCVIDPDRKLRLWIGSPQAARIEIRLDGRRVEPEKGDVRDGQRFTLTPAPGTKRLDVLVAGAEEPTWSVSLARPEDGTGTLHDLMGEINGKADLVHSHIQDRRLAAARATLHGLHLPDQAPAESRCLLYYSRGLLAEREGDYRSALADVHKAVEIAERLKLARYQWLAEQELALLLLGVGRSREAARLFEDLRRMPRSSNPCEHADLLGNHAWSALLAREAGEMVADPIPLLEEALERYGDCERVQPERRANVFLNLALAHLQEGSPAAAQSFLTRAHEIEPDPPLSHTLWALDLEGRIAFLEGRHAAALALFYRLEELALAASSAEARLRAAYGQARSQEALADRTAALATLREAEALLDEQSLQIPVHQGRETFVGTRQGIASLHIRILLDQGSTAQAMEVARRARSRVLRQLEHGDRLAGLPPESRARWVRLITEYQERRTALEERARDDWKLPVDQVRHERAARAAEAEALKQLLDEAFLLLGAPGARPDERQPAPRPGELILAYHPLPRGWVGFARDGNIVEARTFDLPPGVLLRPGELADRLLLPFQDRIRRARQIRVLPSGPLQSVDFHALPFDGDVLLAKVPVVYGLDLPVSTGPAPDPGGRALLVADPRSNLPGALEEARTVGKILKSGSWSTEELQEAEATPEAVWSRLGAADLVHYAGHGTYSGFGGWESGLLLADDTRLTLGDFLALDRVPAWVVLSGCDTGRSSADTPVESLGLAHAFLLAGSRQAVASTRLADDRQVPGFFADLYRQWDREPDLAVALQRAQLAWRERHAGTDWAGFRLFEP